MLIIDKFAIKQEPRAFNKWAVFYMPTNKFLARFPFKKNAVKFCRMLENDPYLESLESVLLDRYIMDRAHIAIHGR